VSTSDKQKVKLLKIDWGTDLTGSVDACVGICWICSSGWCWLFLVRLDLDYYGKSTRPFLRLGLLKRSSKKKQETKRQRLL
jgi:hypothetical protein